MKVKSYADMSVYKYPFYILLHPFIGFSEMKFNKKFALRVSNTIMLLWYFSEVFYRKMSCYDFSSWADKRANVFMIFGSTVAAFGIACLANWMLCTLLDGKGKFFQIWCACSYAFIPLIIYRFLWTFCTYILIRSEAVFLDYLLTVILCWMVLLVVAALMEMHEYTFKKTVFAIFATALTVIILLFIVLMMSMLLQTMYVFIMQIIGELRYKFLYK